MNVYCKQWEYLQSAWQQGRSPQAMMFVGALDELLKNFINQFITFIFCKNQGDKPCGECVDCQMASRYEHPDLQWVRPEKNGGPIKVDQIRELQTYSYLTPQRANQRMIIIESAERMNISAANALLKILEEPAQHTYFLLLAQQISTVLPTILSRCQLLKFSSPINLCNENLLTIGQKYSQESEYGAVVHQAETLLDGMLAILEKKEHPCAIAAQWTKFEFNILLWFFYLVYAQVLTIIVNKSTVSGIAASQFKRLAQLLSPEVIFNQIDKINSLQRKISHNMNVNQTLALEDLLFGL